MNTISIFLTVGAISFVKCQITNNFLEPSLRKNYKQFIKDGDMPINFDEKEVDVYSNAYILEEKKRKNFFEIFTTENSNENYFETSEFFHGFRHLKLIYNQCKNKVNKRLQRTLKTKVNLQVERQLADFKEYVISMYNCVKVYSFFTLDEVLEEKRIPLTDYAYFMKDPTNGTNRSDEKNYRESRKANHKPLPHYANNIINTSWSNLIYERIDKLLQNYSLKLQSDKSLTAEGRGRRRDHRMFAMMVMGFMIMASILIPMGFQFLTVLGGKSLLMAKMALIMSAINGLKKIATSNVGYGFYHTGSDGYHHDHVHHGFHEKLFQTNPNQYNYNP